MKRYPLRSRLLRTSVLPVIVLSACAPAATPQGTASPQPPAPTVAPSATVAPANPTAVAPTETLVAATPKPTDVPHPATTVFQFMAFDTQSQLAVLIGNGTGETWVLDPQTGAWDQRSHMPFSYPADVTYDSAADRVLVFDDGGRMFAYDADADVWTDLKATHNPSGRWLARMAYDAESDRTILFGGIDSSQTNDSSNFMDPEDPTLAVSFAETWAFDFKTKDWTQMNPSLHPAGLSTQSMSYDSESDRIILWGALQNPESVVWTYDLNANSWERIPYTDGPVPGPMAGIAYDPTVDRTFVYLYDQFYAFDYNNRQWQTASGELMPGSRFGATLVYAAGLDRLVLFGGSTLAPKAVKDYVYPPSFDMFQLSTREDAWLYDPSSGEWTQTNTGAQP